MTDYLQPAQTFLTWFKAWPGTTFHDDIEIVDLRARGAGRGIVAKKDIPAGTVLFTIPRKAIITPATSDIVNHIPSLKLGEDEVNIDGEGEEEESENQDAWTALILTMMYEFLRGSQSPWKPYFDVLPVKFDTPMFWADTEVKELQASPVVERIGRAEADEMIRSKVLPVVRAHSNIYFPEGATRLSDDELLALAHRMGSTILAYSFSLEKDEDEDEDEDDDDDENKEEHDEEEHDHDSEGEQGRWVEDKDDQIPLGMIPMADMLNADAEFNAHIHHGNEALAATAVYDIRAGDEILNYYGPLSNGELLRRYGYTTEAHAYFDAVDIPWKLVQDPLAKAMDLSDKETEKIVSKLEDDLEDPVMLDRDFEQDESTGKLSNPASGRVLAELPPTLRRQARAFLHKAYKLKKASDKSSKSRDKKIVADALVDAIAARSTVYPSSLEEDEAQLQALAAAGDMSMSTSAGRLRAALRVRIGEKRLLTEAYRLAKEAAAEAGGGGSEERASKRQKR